METPQWSYKGQKFYKYLSPTSIRAVLDNKTLKWSAPLTFNDPFDVQFDLNVKYDIDRVIAQSVAYLGKAYANWWKLPEGNRFAKGFDACKAAKAPMKDFIATMSAEIRKAIDFIDKTLPKTHEELRAELAKLKVLCATEKNDNLVMWAHYCDCHKGAVIELSVVGDPDSAWAGGRSISYVSDMPLFADNERLVKLLTGGTPTSVDYYHNSVYVKSSDWSYEKEWRTVLAGQDPKTEADFHPFNERELTAVFLGCRMSNDDAKYIRAKIEEKYKYTTVYSAKKDDKRFGLTFTKD